MSTHRLKYVSDSERTNSACEQKWFLRYGIRLAPPTKASAPYAGILWSNLMERLGDRMDDAAMNEVLLWLKAEREVHMEERGQHFLGDVQDTTRVFNNLRSLLRLYVKHYKRVAPGGLGKLMGSELKLRANVRTPTGHPSNRTGYLGILDKLVEDESGDLWVVDHKLTSSNLEEWRYKNADKPQGLTYCWLVQQEYPDRVVRGVIYDLAQSKLPHHWSHFKKIQNGKRLAKPSGGLPYTTADQWGRAIVKNGFGYGDMDATDPQTGQLVDGWYKTVGRKLRARDDSGYWFLRVPVPVTPTQIERAGRELYSVGTRVRRLADSVKETRAKIKAAHELGSPIKFAIAVAEACQSEGWSYPRNPSMCDLYNRRCEFSSLCMEQSVEAAGRYVMREYRSDNNDSNATQAVGAGAGPDESPSEGTGGTPSRSGDGQRTLTDSVVIE
jgi:hypothetical protein